MYFVSNSSFSQCLTLTYLFTFCNSPKHFMKQIILFHNLLGFFFPVPRTSQAQILSLLANKVQKSPGRHSYISEQNLTCNAKIILIVLFLHFWNYWFAFMNYSLKHLSPQSLNIFRVGFHCCVHSIILTATPPRTSQQSGDYKIHSDGKNYGH